MNSSFNTFIEKMMPYAYVILVAYIFSTIVFLFLPKFGINHKRGVNTTLGYQKYDVFHSLNNFKKTETRKKVAVKKVENLSKYTLKAIYSTVLNGGWIIVEKKADRKSIILEKGQRMGDYTLMKLYKTYVIFEKNSKEYKLELTKEKELSYNILKETNLNNQEIIVRGDDTLIKRNYLNSYVNNMEKVWKDISIKEIMKNGEIDGFEVTRINNNSVFQKLGLKPKDIIKSVNGEELKSYADAFKIYNRIDDLDFMVIQILRNNRIMELNYEIN